MERYHTLEALVVGRKAMPGGDVILSFVGPEGASQAVARKAMRPSGRSGRLSLFHHLRFQVYQKPGSDLPTLTQAELVGRLHGLEHPQRFPFAAFLAELAFRVASPEVAARVWPLLVSALKGVAKHANPRLVAIWGGWRILKAAGLAPNLHGEGTHLLDGDLAPRGGVYLGLEGLEALAAVLRLPGSEAIDALEGTPLDRLMQALLAHTRYTVGELGSAVLLSNSNAVRRE
ncbi:MAG: DNA recombination protein RecO [Meiothermus sp.]